jgi:hypothetical protein
MTPVESQALRVIEELAILGELADTAGASGLAASTFAAILMLADSANEDGVVVDCEALGISGA